MRNKVKGERQETKGSRLKVILPPSSFILGCALVAAAGAQPYPTRPIRLIVPQSAGGSTDVIARVVAQRMTEALGQTVIVDNRPGAGSLNGIEIVAHAVPDGYTLLGVAASYTINPALHKKLPFDPIRDFAPITQLATLPHILVVHPSMPVNSVNELIALARAKPGVLNFASSGIATSTHLAAELFMYMTTTSMVNVPFKGGAPAMVGMLSGQCQLNFATISTALPHVKSGRLRALAVTTATRSDALPDIPTVGEFLPGYEGSNWYGLGVPKATPAEIVDQLNKEVNAALDDPKMKARLADLGGVALPGSPANFGKLIADETEKWGKVIRAANIKPE